MLFRRFRCKLDNLFSFCFILFSRSQTVLVCLLDKCTHNTDLHCVRKKMLSVIIINRCYICYIMRIGCWGKSSKSTIGNPFYAPFFGFFFFIFGSYWISMQRANNGNRYRCACTLFKLCEKSIKLNFYTIHPVFV